MFLLITFSSKIWHSSCLCDVFYCTLVVSCSLRRPCQMMYPRVIASTKQKHERRVTTRNSSCKHEEFFVFYTTYKSCAPNNYSAPNYCVSFGILSTQLFWCIYFKIATKSINRRKSLQMYSCTVYRPYDC